MCRCRRKHARLNSRGWAQKLAGDENTMSGLESLRSPIDCELCRQSLVGSSHLTEQQIVAVEATQFERRNCRPFRRAMVVAREADPEWPRGNQNDVTGPGDSLDLRGYEINIGQPRP